MFLFYKYFKFSAFLLKPENDYIGPIFKGTDHWFFFFFFFCEVKSLGKSGMANACFRQVVSRIPYNSSRIANTHKCPSWNNRIFDTGHINGPVSYLRQDPLCPSILWTFVREAPEKAWVASEPLEQKMRDDQKFFWMFEFSELLKQKIPCQ